VNDWREVQLGHLIHVKHGFAFKGEFFAETGADLVLTPGNFTIGGGLQVRPGKERYYTGDFPSEFRLRPGDLLIVMTDLKQDAPILGSPAWVPDEGSYLHNQRLGLVTITRQDALDRSFLYWLLASDGVREQLRATATGTTVRHTAPERIYQVRVNLPDIATQRRIAEILDAIDHLMKNNRLRISLLEQMAQATHREWFVHFRYPGCENDALVASPLGPIPASWSVVSLGDLVDEIRESARPSAETASLPYVPIDAITPRSLTLRNHRPGSEAASSLRLFRKGDILFGAMRAYFHKVCIAPFDGVTRSTSFVLRLDRQHYHYLALLLADEKTVSYAAAHSSGSTIPYAKWAGGLREMKALKPPADLAERFGLLAAPMLEMAGVLAGSDNVLRTIRDALLPRLVTGAIDVSSLDLDALLEESAA
jgi:type I restriction enzyme, S subunit